LRRNTTTAVAAQLTRLPEPSTDESWRQGILLKPLIVDGQLQGEAGQTVRYRDTGTGLEVVVGVHSLAREVPAEWVIPYHPDYSPSRVYLLLTRKRRVLGTLGSDRNGYLLAWNVAREFPDHPLHEDLVLLACELAEACEANGSGKFPHTRFLISQYLRVYARGRYRDRLEWMNARLCLRIQHRGDPLETLEAFKRFLATHPGNTQRAEIKLAMARLYRIAAQWLISTGGSKHKAIRYLRRARHIYLGLSGHSDLEASQTARVALFELTQGITRRAPA
jgi:hypothetical protein